MRTLGRIAVGTGALGVLLMTGQGVASAQVASVLNVDVRLDPTAPTAGEIVTGLRSVEGEVRAIEGIRRIDLYVVPSGIGTRDLSDAVPVDSFVSDVPLSKADFDLHWDSADTAPRLVDLVVVARTATRNGSVQVPGVRVERVVTAVSAPPAVAPKKAVAPAAKPVAAPVARPVVTAPKPATRTVRPASTNTAVTVSRGEVGAAQAQAFYATFGQLPYAADMTPASLARAASIEAANRRSRGAWPFAAAGLVLMVSAAHAQRIVRVAPRSSAAL